MARLKRKPTKSVMGTRKDTRVNEAHKKWVRGFECSVKSDMCNGKIEAAHVRSGTDGGTGLKPSDRHVIPLCSFHHKVQHAQGEHGFELTHGISMLEIAQRLAKQSPHLRKRDD